jgi:phenylalanine-4-hydroxylase
VVEQDYAQYTEIDHSVWRFVMLQARARLQHTAHPAYAAGLSASGISVERIPRIEEMNEKLSRFGWGAVCVDGFIPPRAFQAFQANRILPIAADIRSAQHLAYTPAPDIIHEAAGHAPILCEPSYARFIQEFGIVSEQAFENPADREVYRTIHALSEIKEDPSSTSEQREHAHAALQTALASVSEISEASLLARLYWWTAEYGLIGSPEDYRLYGAGLLSSLGESHSCHAESVRKLPLSAECVQFDYDITREQPQLFVARDFDQLLTVLDELTQTLACRRGGLEALHKARRSEDTASFTLDTGLTLVGTLTDFQVSAGRASSLQFGGVPALFTRETRLEIGCPNRFVLPLGELRDGRSLAALSPDVFAHYKQQDRVYLELASGSTLSGSLRGTQVQDGRMQLLNLEDFELREPDGRSFCVPGIYPLPLAGSVVGVRAGAPAAYFGHSEPSRIRVPPPRWWSLRERRLLALYEQALASFRQARGAQPGARAGMVAVFEAIAAELDRAYPEDWLLRWNLLESLAKLSEGASLRQTLERRLEQLEVEYAHREPIATGLSTIRALTEVTV